MTLTREENATIISLNSFGYSNRRIANMLNKSPTTIDKYIKTLGLKLNYNRGHKIRMNKKRERAKRRC